VLDLIKVDKLFLTDSCTARVIRQAEFQNDRTFFKQLAKAIGYKPQLGSKKVCRLYLCVIFNADAIRGSSYVDHHLSRRTR
jgi:hypothetical protein